MRSIFVTYTLTMSLVVSQTIFALPQGAQVINGNAIIQQNGTTLNITNSNGTIINWNSFSIGQGQTTNFQQSGANSAILNRVIGNNLSQIYGNLKSNGRVILINPNGVLVGPMGRINTASFFASTHNLSNENFLNNKFLFEGANANGAIVNLGEISATGGDVFLIANKVVNEGSITARAGEVGLAAAKDADVLLADGEDRRILIKTGAATQISDEGVVNKGSIEAAKVELAAHGGNVYALGIKNEGSIRANTLQEVGGRIMLLAEEGNIKLAKGSVLDASGKNGGGDINVGGSRRGEGPLPNAANLEVEEETIVKADALENGDGGQIILFAKDDASFAGKISSKGGSESGNGGFIETSGQGSWRYDNWLTDVDLSAANGEFGAFLIDPPNFIVTDGVGGDAITPTTSGNGVGNFTDDAITTFLQGGTSLTLFGVAGLAFADGVNITWNSAANFHFGTSGVGAGSVTLDGTTISSQGTGSITIDAGSAGTGVATEDNSFSNFEGAVALTDSTITSVNGDITINANLGDNPFGTTTYAFLMDDSSTISSTGTGANAANINITATTTEPNGSGNAISMTDANQTISTVDGDITIAGTATNNDATPLVGVQLTGTISSTGTGANAGNISITGTTVGTGTSAPTALNVQAIINSVDGDVSLTGTTHASAGAASQAVSLQRNINITGDGNVTVTGNSPTGTDIRYNTGSATTIGGATATGDITYVANDLEITAANLTTQSSGTLTIRPFTSNTTISVGDAPTTTGTLDISKTEFSSFLDGFESIIIGDAAAGTGAVDIGDVELNDNLTVFGGSINITGPVVEAGTLNAVNSELGSVGAVNFASHCPFVTSCTPPTPPTPPNTTPPTQDSGNQPSTTEQNQTTGVVTDAQRQGNASIVFNDIITGTQVTPNDFLSIIAGAQKRAQAFNAENAESQEALLKMHREKRELEVAKLKKEEEAKRAAAIAKREAWEKANPTMAAIQKKLAYQKKVLAQQKADSEKNAAANKKAMAKLRKDYDDQYEADRAAGIREYLSNCESNCTLDAAAADWEKNNSDRVLEREYHDQLVDNFGSEEKLTAALLGDPEQVKRAIDKIKSLGEMTPEQWSAWLKEQKTADQKAKIANLEKMRAAKLENERMIADLKAKRQAQEEQLAKVEAQKKAELEASNEAGFGDDLVAFRKWKAEEPIRKAQADFEAKQKEIQKKQEESKIATQEWIKEQEEAAKKEEQRLKEIADEKARVAAIYRNKWKNKLAQQKVADAVAAQQKALDDAQKEYGDAIRSKGYLTKKLETLKRQKSEWETFSAKAQVARSKNFGELYKAKEDQLTAKHELPDIENTLAHGDAQVALRTKWLKEDRELLTRKAIEYGMENLTTELAFLAASDVAGTVAPYSGADVIIDAGYIVWDRHRNAEQKKELQKIMDRINSNYTSRNNLQKKLDYAHAHVGEIRKKAAGVYVNKFKAEKKQFEKTYSEEFAKNSQAQFQIADTEAAIDRASFRISKARSKVAQVTSASSSDYTKPDSYYFKQDSRYREAVRYENIR